MKIFLHEFTSFVKFVFLDFCVITFEQIEIKTSQASQNDRLNLGFLKDVYVAGKKMALNSRKMAIYQLQKNFNW